MSHSVNGSTQWSVPTVVTNNAILYIHVSEKALPLKYCLYNQRSTVPSLICGTARIGPEGLRRLMSPLQVVLREPASGRVISIKGKSQKKIKMVKIKIKIKTKVKITKIKRNGTT